MNPIFRLIVAQLPRLLPVVESMLRRPDPPKPDHDRLAAYEQSVNILVERSDSLEAKVKRLRVYVIVSFLLSLATLIIMLVRS